MDARPDPLWLEPEPLELLEPSAGANGGPNDSRTLEHAPDLAVLRWLTPDRRPRPAPDDASVRRVLPYPAAAAIVALEGYLGERGVSSEGQQVTISGGHGHLVLMPRSTDRSWVGVVHLRRGIHAVPVHLVIDQWSALRTELRLERTDTRRRGLRGLGRWYDVAHPILDVLRFEIGLRASAVVTR